MLKKKYYEEKENNYKNTNNEELDFNGTDILAFIIAFFQLLFPYVVGTLLSFTIVVFLLSRCMK